MPARFIGISGVYDIAQHYQYEYNRGVHEISTMKRAMGGPTHFGAFSPSVLLGATLDAAAAGASSSNVVVVNGGSCSGGEAGAGSSSGSSSNGSGSSAAASAAAASNARSSSAARLHGDVIASKVGFGRDLHSSNTHSDSASGRQALPYDLAALRSSEHWLDVPLAAAARLPPSVLMSSCTDMTVPWYESAEMYWRLYDCGVPVRHLVYNKVGHGDFVIDYPAAMNGGAAGLPSEFNSPEEDGGAAGLPPAEALLQRLPQFGADLVACVWGQPGPRYDVRPPAAAAAAIVGAGVARDGPFAAAGATGRC